MQIVFWDNLVHILTMRLTRQHRRGHGPSASMNMHQHPSRIHVPCTDDQTLAVLSGAFGLRNVSESYTSAPITTSDVPLFSANADVSTTNARAAPFASPSGCTMTEQSITAPDFRQNPLPAYPSAHETLYGGGRPPSALPNADLQSGMHHSLYPYVFGMVSSGYSAGFALQHSQPPYPALPPLPPSTLSQPMQNAHTAASSMDPGNSPPDVICKWGDCSISLDDLSRGGIVRHLNDFHLQNKRNRRMRMKYLWNGEGESPCCSNVQRRGLGKHIAAKHLRSPACLVGNPSLALTFCRNTVNGRVGVPPTTSNDSSLMSHTPCRSPSAIYDCACPLIFLILISYAFSSRMWPPHFVYECPPFSHGGLH